MTGPSSSPRGEHTPRPGITWQTRLVSTGEQLIDNDAPDPRPNRATRRAAARAAQTRAPIRQYPDVLREQAESDDLAVHPPDPAATEATDNQEQP